MFLAILFDVGVHWSWNWCWKGSNSALTIQQYSRNSEISKVVSVALLLDPGLGLALLECKQWRDLLSKLVRVFALYGLESPVKLLLRMLINTGFWQTGFELLKTNFKSVLGFTGLCRNFCFVPSFVNTQHWTNVTHLLKTSRKSHFLLLEYDAPFESETNSLYSDTKIIILSQS